MDLFENAKFGDWFLTSDGTKVRFITADENYITVLEYGKSKNFIWTFDTNGYNECLDCTIVEKLENENS